MGPGGRGSFQRAISMDGKPPGGPGGAGRRPALVKQENVMGGSDGCPGNMGGCSSVQFLSVCSYLSAPHRFRVRSPQFLFLCYQAQ